jgi:Na+-driven multidrug efflux pump
LRLSVTLVAFQSLLGLVLSCCFLGAAPQFAAAFVPANIVSQPCTTSQQQRCQVDQSVKYVRISAFSSLFSTISVSIAAAARSLDQPDIPFVVSLCTTSANIVLDMCFLSTFRPAHINPTVNTQAAIRLACDGFGAAAGLAYFARILWRLSFDGLQPTKMSLRQCRPSLAAWKTLARAGQFFFAETVVRNALYLWQVHTIIGLGSLWATSFGVFNTIRWGLIMVPVQTLEATALVFVGHRFGEWTKRKGHSASRRDLFSQPSFARPRVRSSPQAFSDCPAGYDWRRHRSGR